MLFIILYYKNYFHDIQWSSGTTIGFNAGDGVHYYTVPEYLTADDVLNLDHTSNVGIPGMYIYRVDQDPCMYDITLTMCYEIRNYLSSCEYI